MVVSLDGVIHQTLSTIPPCCIRKNSSPQNPVDFSDSLHRFQIAGAETTHPSLQGKRSPVVFADIVLSFHYPILISSSLMIGEGHFLMKRPIKMIPALVLTITVIAACRLETAWRSINA